MKPEIQVVNDAPDSDSLTIDVLKDKKCGYYYRICVGRAEDGECWVTILDGITGEVLEYQLGIESNPPVV